MRSALICFAIFVCTGGHAGAQEHRIASLAPDGSMWMKHIRSAAARIEQATDGRVRHKFYAGASQGGERDVVRKLRLGQLDGAVLTSVGLAMIYPGIRVLELPYMFRSEAELDYVRDKLWPYFQQKFTEQGFELLAQGEIGWVHVFTTHEVTTFDQLRAIKMWAWQDDPIVRQLFRGLGLAGVPLGVPEVLGSLKTGRIDACYGSPLAAVAMQWHSHIRFMTDKPIAYALGGTVLRRDVWERASQADRAAQRKIFADLAKQTVTQTRANNARARTALIDSGIRPMTLGPEVSGKLRAAAAALHDNLVGTVFTAQELELAMRYRAEYRAAASKR